MYPNEFRTVCTGTRPSDGRTLGERLHDGCRAFLRAFRRRDVNVTIEMIGGGGGGSARVTQMF